MVGSDRLQQPLLVIGVVAAAVLLGRFAIDLSAGMSIIVSAPFWGLVVAAVVVAGANALATPVAAGSGMGNWPQGLLLIAIPAGFLASSLDCTGLAAEGCAPFCTFTKLVWVPLIALCCALYYLKERQSLLTTILLMSFVPLAPHCVCYNVGNGWWIDRLGASPVCYAWGFTASLLAVSTLRSRRRAWAGIVLCLAIISGATAFFIGHHYFHFPW